MSSSAGGVGGREQQRGLSLGQTAVECTQEGLGSLI